MVRGWVMQNWDEEFSSSGKVESYSRERNSYRAELHGLLSMMAGAWKIQLNSKAQVKAYCDNQNFVGGFKKLQAAIGRDW